MISAHVMDLTVREFKPHIGLHADSAVCLGDFLYFSLSLYIYIYQADYVFYLKHLFHIHKVIIDRNVLITILLIAFFKNCLISDWSPSLPDITEVALWLTVMSWGRYRSQESPPATLSLSRTWLYSMKLHSYTSDTTFFPSGDKKMRFGSIYWGSEITTELIYF